MDFELGICEARLFIFQSHSQDSLVCSCERTRVPVKNPGENAIPCRTPEPVN